MKRINLMAFMLIGMFCSIFCETAIAQAYYNDTVRVHCGQTSVTAKDSILRYVDKTYTNNYIADRIGLGNAQTTSKQAFVYTFSKKYKQTSKKFFLTLYNKTK